MRQILSENTNTVLFGIFNNEELQEQDPEDGYSISAWGQFQASADALRWYGDYCCAVFPSVYIYILFVILVTLLCVLSKKKQNLYIFYLFIYLLYFYRGI